MKKTLITTALLALLGGGAPQPIGQYDAAIQILETGVFEANGIKLLHTNKREAAQAQVRSLSRHPFA